MPTSALKREKWVSFVEVAQTRADTCCAKVGFGMALESEKLVSFVVSSISISGMRISLRFAQLVKNKSEVTNTSLII